MKPIAHTALTYLALSLIMSSAAIAETPVAQECTDLNARYTMQDAEGFELHFENASDENDFFTTIQAVLTTPNNRYVLGFSSSSGRYWDNFLAFSDDDVLHPDRSSVPVYRFDAELNPMEDLLGSETPAAQYYFMPEVSRVLQYQVRDAEFLPKRMWEFAGCN